RGSPRPLPSEVEENHLIRKSHGCLIFNTVHCEWSEWNERNAAISSCCGKGLIYAGYGHFSGRIHPLPLLCGQEGDAEVKRYNFQHMDRFGLWSTALVAAAG